MEWKQKVPTDKPEGFEKIDRLIPHSPFESTINSICKVCNESWMNDIENQVEECIVNLAYGRQFSGTIQDSNSLALWASKTALVRALKDTGNRVIPSDKYKWVEENLTPPADTYIWIFRAEPAPDNFYDRNLRFQIKDDDVYGQQTTFVLGELGIIILSFNRPMRKRDPQNIDSLLAPITDNCHIRLWPEPKQIEWPLAKVVPGRDVVDIVSKIVFALAATNP
ncbi:hypothetical protein EX462_11130 [Vibrio alginolyticus]|nr:hypothetical protein [Vibrio alginolyticus]